MLIDGSNGEELKAYVAANPSATVTLDPAWSAFEVATPNNVWPASSRGPSPGSFGVNPTNVIKPELVAVGVTVYTATQKVGPQRGYLSTPAVTRA